VAGLITGLSSLFLHLFWKFRTANTNRGRWKILIPLAWLRQRNNDLIEIIVLSKLYLDLVQKKRKSGQIYSIRDYQKKTYKHYKRHAA
tara:strand:+ start:763 stop:1026 length:264 start_codon:yes stop_codon:yes gene_type:complete